jgi:hypothetical protein
MLLIRVGLQVEQFLLHRLRVLVSNLFPSLGSETLTPRERFTDALRFTIALVIPLATSWRLGIQN